MAYRDLYENQVALLVRVLPQAVIRKCHSLVQSGH